MNCSTEMLNALAPRGSQTLKNYLEQVYGPGGSASTWARVWRWERVDIVWLAFLPATAALQLRRSRCTGPAGFGSIYAAPGKDREMFPSNSLWRYGHRTLCKSAIMPNAPATVPREVCDPEKGGPRSPPLVVGMGPWIEVSHVYVRPWRPYERTFLWMYKAVGSGLWYRLGRTAICSDTVDLSRMLNLTLVDAYVWVKDRDAPRLGGGVGVKRTKRGVLEEARVRRHPISDPVAPTSAIPVELMSHH